MKLIKNISIINLGKVYDMKELGEVMDFYNSEEIKYSEKLIIDCSELEIINMIGGELFGLQDKVKEHNENGPIFCSVSDNVKFVLERLAEMNGISELRIFNNVNEALITL